MGRHFRAQFRKLRWASRRLEARYIAGADPDPEEHDLVLRPASIAEFEEMLLDGTIRDGCTIAAWGLYKLWKERCDVRAAC